MDEDGIRRQGAVRARQLRVRDPVVGGTAIGDPVRVDMGPGLLERARELGVIDTLVADAAAGRGSAHVFAGPPGIGKSSLLHQAVRRARTAGLRVLSVRLDELDGAVPFGVARDLLAPELAAVDVTRTSPLVRRALEALGQPPAEPEGVERDHPMSSSSVRHALYWLVAGLADRNPLLLSVDDAQWADIASVRFLGHLARRIDGLPVALVVATRRGDVGLAGQVLEQIGSLDQVLSPRPLTEDATARLARARFGDVEVPEQLCADLHSCTAGNPLALGELLSALRDSGITPEQATPSLVRSLGAGALAHRVQRWLRTVSVDAVQLAHGLAVVGDIGGPDVVGAVIDVPADRARAAAAELVGAELVQTVAKCRFVHPLMRDAIRDLVQPPVRDRLARRAAELLASRPDPIAAAGQLLGVAPSGDAWVAETLVTAACISVDRGAPDVAIPLLRRAIAEPPPPARRADVWASLGRAQLTLGDPDAVVSLEEARRHTDSARTRGLIARDLAQALVNVVRLGEAGDVLEHAATDLRVTSSPHAAGAPGARSESATDDAELVDELETRRLMFGTWDPQQRTLVVDELAQEQSGRQRRGAFAQRLSLMVRALEAVASCRPAEEGADLVARALADDTLVRRAPSIAIMGVPLLSACGQTQQARRHVESMIVRARTSGSLPELRASIGLRGQISMLEGDVQAAETDGWAMQDLLEEGELGAPYLLGFLTEALLAQDRVDTAEATLRGAGLMEGGLPDLAPLNTILLARGRVRVAQGDLHAGLEDLVRCGERQERLGQHNPALNPWRAAAVEAMTKLGRYDEAVETAEEELALARRFGADHVVGAALRSRAGAGPGPPQVDLLEEARSRLTPSLARLTLAHVHHDLGVALLAGGDQKAARASFNSALELARQLTATRLVARSAEGVLAAGGRPRHDPAHVAETLTPAERRVAELAVTGARNREIAQALFVTEKTVETHLRHSFRKLGLSSRAQLAAALRGRAPVSPRRS